MESEKVAKCELCGEPMPPGEQMFKYHGYSGPCPKDQTPPRPVESDAIHDVLLKAQRSLGIGHPTARAAIAQAAQHILRLEAEIERLARRGAAAGELVEALKEGLKLAELAEQMTGCRSDDQYVWAVQRTIRAAILKAEGAQENGNG